MDFGVGGEIEAIRNVHHVLANDDVVLRCGDGLQPFFGVRQFDDSIEGFFQLGEARVVFALDSFQLGLQLLDLLLVGGFVWILTRCGRVDKDGGDAEVACGLLDLGETGRAGVAGGEFHGRDFPSVVLAGGIARGEHGLGKDQRWRLRREGGGRSLSLCSMCAPGVLSAAADWALR